MTLKRMLIFNHAVIKPVKTRKEQSELNGSMLCRLKTLADIFLNGVTDTQTAKTARATHSKAGNALQVATQLVSALSQGMGCGRTLRFGCADDLGERAVSPMASISARCFAPGVFLEPVAWVPPCGGRRFMG